MTKENYDVLYCFYKIPNQMKQMEQEISYTRIWFSIKQQSNKNNRYVL
jgi:hypothetical protein